MAPVPELLRLVDSSERWTKCHLWCGAFANRVPFYAGQRAIVALWEAANDQHIPHHRTLVNDCGLMTCVRLDHWHLGRYGEAVQVARQRRIEAHMAALQAA